MGNTVEYRKLKNFKEFNEKNKELLQPNIVNVVLQTPDINTFKNSNQSVIKTIKRALEKKEVNFNKEKDRAYKQAIPQAVKETKKELADTAKGRFNVQSKTFAGMFTGKQYNQKNDKLPAVLFFTRSHYFSVFEFGANIKPQKSKGLFIPFAIDGKSPYQKRNGRKNFKTMLENLKKSGKTFWKKVNGLS